MIIDDKIRDKKLQYSIKREAVNISALLSGKIDKYKYLAGEEMLPSNQRQTIEQGKFAYSSLEKAFEKPAETIEDQGIKQIKAIEDHSKQLVESNELIKKNFNIDKDSITLKEQ